MNDAPTKTELARKVVEECAELIQAICKAERFGWNNHHPKTPNISNERRVYEELADVKLACADLDMACNFDIF